MLNGISLQRQRTVKYLGVIFDQGLTWKYHIDDLVQKCKQPLQMMRKVAKHDWGGDRASLKMMYIALIRSKIDYASFLYSNAADCHLIKRDRIQYQGIRIITGNIKNSDMDNLEAEINLMPLKYRRKVLALLYFGKAYRMRNHPAKKVFEEFHYFEHYVTRPYAIPIEGRAKCLLSNLKIPVDKLEQFKSTDLYIPRNINIKFNLLKIKSSCTSLQFQHDYKLLVENQYMNFCIFFTNGSKTDNGCGCAYFVDLDPSTTVGKKLPKTCSIFNAEMYSIVIALKFIQSSSLSNFVMFTDSLSALQFSKLDHWIKIRIHKVINRCNKNIIFEWVPGHSDIKGNDKADSAAKQIIAQNRIVKLPLIFSDYKFLVKKQIYQQWQLEW